MSYFAVCSFDLKDGSYQDYENAYAELATLGLSKIVKSDQGQTVRLPTTMTAGLFNGIGALAVRTDLASWITAAFARRGLKSEIFVSVGGDWGWGHRLT